MQRLGLQQSAADRRRDDQSRVTPRSRSRRTTAAPPSTCPTRRAPWASRATCCPTSSADGYIAEVAADYEKIRVQHAGKKGPALVPLAEARANAFATDWAHYAAPAPTFIGRREFRNVDLANLRRCIDWGPFFQTWELPGPYPAILDDAVVGEAARNVLADGQAMLKRIVDGRWLTANGVVALSAGAVGGRRHRAATPTRRATEVALTWHGCASRTNGRRASPTTASPTSSRRARRAWPITSAPSR